MNGAPAEPPKELSCAVDIEQALAAVGRGRVERPGLAWGVSAASAAALVALLVASILQMAARTYNPFIYYRF